MSSLRYRLAGTAIMTVFAGLLLSSSGAIPDLATKSIANLFGYSSEKPSPKAQRSPDTTSSKTPLAPCAGIYPTSGMIPNLVPEAAPLSNSPSTGCADMPMTGGATMPVSGEDNHDPVEFKHDTDDASVAGSPKASKMGLAESSIAETKQSPVQVSTAPPNIGFVVAGTPSDPVPKPAPTPVVSDPVARELPGNSSTPLRTAPIGETEPVAQVDATRSEVLRKPVKTREATPTPEPTQSRTPKLETGDTTDSVSNSTQGTAATQPGVSVPGGIQAPELHLALQPWQVRALLASGGVVAFAVSERTEKEVAYFDRARSQFRPIAEWSGHISDRFIAVKDEGLVASWSFYCSAFDVNEASAFVIRFTPDFERQIVSAQFAALDKDKIDFSEVVQKHRHIVTNGRLTDDLQFVVESVNAN